MGAAAKALLGVAAIAIAVALFVILRDDGGEPAGSTAAQETTASGQAASGAGEGGGASGAGGREEKPRGPDGPAESRPATIVVKNGRPVGGVKELEFTKGETIELVVESDVDEEVHLHGYDVSEEVRAGGTAEFSVPATIEGVFELELELSVVPLAEIVVNPA